MTSVMEMDPRHVRRLDRRTFLVHYDGEVNEVCNVAGLPQLGDQDGLWGRVTRVAVEGDLDEPGVYTVNVDYVPPDRHELN